MQTKIYLYLFIYVYVCTRQIKVCCVLCGYSFARYSEVFHPNLQSFVWRRRVGAPERGANMAGVKKQKLGYER